SHLHPWRELLQHLVNFAGVFHVTLTMPVDEDRLRTQFVSRPQRHGRVHAELARRIRCRRHHAPLVGFPTHYHRFALERRIEQLFHRDEERVHVEVEITSHGFRASSTRGIPARSFTISTPVQEPHISRTAPASPSSIISQPPGRSSRRASGTSRW